MEERKEKEIRHYDKRAEKQRKEPLKEVDFEGFDQQVLASYRFCYNLLRKNCHGKKVLDYGCGNGIHNIFLGKTSNEVVGIDLSEHSLAIARQKIEKAGLLNVKFQVSDCEKMDFPDNTFDVVFDGGTFSSLDNKKAFSEIARVLNPSGVLIGIETFGHNPLTNFKRKINKKTGKRTEWAVGHIIKDSDLEHLSSFFEKTEIKHFHLFSWILFPFINLPGFKLLLKIIEIGDNILLKLPLFKKYAFKVVFICSNVKKNI